MDTSLVQHRITLAPRPGANAVARDTAHRFLADAREHGRAVPDPAPDTLLLLVTELVTNALRHTDGPCTLTLTLHGGAIDVDVTDTSPHPPTPRAPDHRGLGGWGWNLVHHLTESVEIRPTADGGKTIHARIALE
ncbi:ATP-binding protein [Streptomyces sp. NPDC051578]|uniref:ATP-binding protein n=1 Tax=Streptomyces sp. NPDC051578 TaxID=3365662 RepID=UPI0037B32136